MIPCACSEPRNVQWVCAGNRGGEAHHSSLLQVQAREGPTQGHRQRELGYDCKYQYSSGYVGIGAVATHVRRGVGAAVQRQYCQ